MENKGTGTQLKFWDFESFLATHPNLLKKRRGNSLRKSIAQSGPNFAASFNSKDAKPPKMINLKQFKNDEAAMRFFSNEQSCRKYPEERLWGGKMFCPKCGHEKIYRTNRGYRCGDRECGRKFTVTTGTVMENTKIKVKYWLQAMYHMTQSRNGITVKELANRTGVCTKTSWFMLQRIRIALNDEDTGQLKGFVACDETMVGGKNRNRKFNKKISYKFGGRYIDKVPVLGMLEKGGRVRMIVLPMSTESAVLQPLIEKHIQKGSIVVTDEWEGYVNVSRSYEHYNVNHSQHKYVNNGFSTNGVEGFFGIVKNTIRGTHHCIYPRHLQKYLYEMVYRYNTRDYNAREATYLIAGHLQGRLKWKDLIGKEKYRLPMHMKLWEKVLEGPVLYDIPAQSPKPIEFPAVEEDPIYGSMRDYFRHKKN